jgi:hypothetical protein
MNCYVLLHKNNNGITLSSIRIFSSLEILKEFIDTTKEKKNNKYYFLNYFIYQTELDNINLNKMDLLTKKQLIELGVRE